MDNNTDADKRKLVSWKPTQRSVHRVYQYQDGSIKKEVTPRVPAQRYKNVRITEVISKMGIKFECDIPASIMGKRKQKRFGTLEEAKIFIDQAIIRKQNKGLEGFSLKTEDQTDAINALKILNGRGLLVEAAGFYIKHHFPKAGDITLIALQAKYEKNLSDLNRRPHTRREAASRLNNLISQLGPKTLVKDVSSEGIAEYFKSNLQWSPHTNKSHYSILRAFFNFALEEGYIQRNPINAVKRPPKTPETKPGILSVEEAFKLLEAIYTTRNEGQKSIGPYVVLGLFCGIRTEELDRLKWDKVYLEQQMVEISDDIAKKHRVRYVDLPDNALKWLQIFEVKKSGNIRAKNHRRHFEISRDQAGIKSWPKNAMRHSFASYHYELYGDAKKTSNQLGHEGVDLLFSHYRTLTKKGSGSEYFTILPTTTESNITSILLSA